MTMIDFENNFFGRRSIIDLLKRRVLDLREGYRQNVALLGDRHIGKTSILKKFIFELGDEGVVDVYVDLENKDFYSFFLKISGGLLYNFCRNKKLPQQHDLKLLLESTKRLIPQTVEEIKRIEGLIAKDKIAEAYRDILSLPEVFSNETGLFCVIILDEFHFLEDFLITNVYQELGKKIMTQKKCLYLVSSSREDLVNEILQEKLSLLFGNFEIIHVCGFDLKTSQEFIAQNLHDLKMNSTLKNFIIDFTGGHPFYLNIISQELIQQSAIHHQSEIFIPLLMSSIENTIFNRWGVLNRHFEIIVDQLCANRGSRAVLAILTALVSGQSKLSAIGSNSGISKILLSAKFNRLLELDIVIKNGNFYYLKDKLFKYWIKYVLQKKLHTIDIDARAIRDEFHREMEGLICHFQVISQKDLSSRIAQLLQCFDNISLTLNGRRYKLPAFNKITSLKAASHKENDMEVIRASAQEGEWFIALKEEGICEMDVNVFLTESKRIIKNPQQRIIISLRELDANARLKALQEKMWIWNESELNALLNLYDQPYIVK